MYVIDVEVVLPDPEAIREVVLDRLLAISETNSVSSSDEEFQIPSIEIQISVGDSIHPGGWQIETITTHFGLPEVEWETYVSRPVTDNASLQKEYVKLVSIGGEVSAVQSLAVATRGEFLWKTPNLMVLNILSR